jgi:hypothetical protein
MISQREKDYVEQVLNKTSVSVKDHINYDLNYRLKKKFERLHSDYWLLVRFFRKYETNISSYNSTLTKTIVEKANSQVETTLVSLHSRCRFCKISKEDLQEPLLEIPVCKGCNKQFP